jgi:hypothetical protein
MKLNHIIFIGVVYAVLLNGSVVSGDYLRNNSTDKTWWWDHKGNDGGGNVVVDCGGGCAGR